MGKLEEYKMVDLSELQKQVYQNKLDKNFNVTDISKEFALTYGELAEAMESHILQYFLLEKI